MSYAVRIKAVENRMVVIRRKRFLRMIGVLAMTAGALVSRVAFAEQSNDFSICSDFKKLLAMPAGKGLQQFMLESHQNPKGEDQYSNLDIDGDDKNDEVLGGCYGSLMPSDPCNLSVELSSGKKVNIVFKINEKFYLARYRSHVYAIASPASVVADDKTGNARTVTIDEIRGHRTVYILNKNGINPICKSL